MAIVKSPGYFILKCQKGFSQSEEIIKCLERRILKNTDGL